ncbi:MAG: putative metalloprotease CJM1_0395 family protein [Anaerolineae bacterium]
MEISGAIQAYPRITYGDPGNLASDARGAGGESVAPERARNPSGGLAGADADLTGEDQRKVEELKARDREVRAHKQAHQAAAGQHAIGDPVYGYETGPDGRRYAVSGEVEIDTSEIPGEPEATIRKMQQIRRAALAPQDPSGQDRRVAAEASRKEAAARQELAAQQREESQPPAAPRFPPEAAAANYARMAASAPGGANLNVSV